MGMKNKKNISVYHMLQSCGVQAGSYPKTEVKIETHIAGLKRVILTWNLGFHFPKLDYHQWLKVHTFSIWEIKHLKEFNMLVLLSKQSVAQRRSCREIYVHQVVANCCSCNFFPKFLKFWTLLLILSCLGLFSIPEICCPSATNLDFLEFVLRSIVSFISEVVWSKFPFV